MRQKFGNWILDVAKYITTVGLIAPFITNITSVWTTLLLLGGVVVMVAFGLYLSRDDKKENKDSKKKK